MSVSTSNFQCPTPNGAWPASAGFLGSWELEAGSRRYEVCLPATILPPQRSQMSSPWSTANQPSSAAAHSRHASASAISSSCVERPSRTACSAIAELVIRSAQSLPHQSRSCGVAKHQTDAEASIRAKSACRAHESKCRPAQDRRGSRARFLDRARATSRACRRRDASERAVVRVTDGDDAAGRGDAAHFLQGRYWIGEVLQQLMCVHDVERCIRNIHSIHVTYGERDARMIAPRFSNDLPLMHRSRPRHHARGAGRNRWSSSPDHTPRPAIGRRRANVASNRPQSSPPFANDGIAGRFRDDRACTPPFPFTTLLGLFTDLSTARHQCRKGPSLSGLHSFRFDPDAATSQNTPSAVAMMAADIAATADALCGSSMPITDRSTSAPMDQLSPTAPRRTQSWLTR